MKKKIIALILCLVMILPMLVACNNKEEEDVEGEILSQTDGTKTLTMWVVTENKKTDVDEDGNPCFSKEVLEAQDAVEQAFSKITKSKYKTNVDMRFLTIEDYYKTLEPQIKYHTESGGMYSRAERALSYYLEYMKRQIESGAIPYMDIDARKTQFYVDYPEYWEYREGAVYDDSDDSDSDEEEYILNEWGIPELKYPDAQENQVDIIYLSGYTTFMDYVENGWVAPLDDHLTGVAALLSDYIAPALLDGIKVGGMTYAIPNNIAIGEYTYMFIDKEIYDDFGYGQAFTSEVGIVDCESFLNDVANSGKYSDILPIDSSFDEVLSQLVWYWNIDYETYIDSLGEEAFFYQINKDNKFSLMGAMYGDPANATRGKISLGYNALMANPEYRETYATLKGYEMNGYFGEKADNQRAAISFMNGDYSIKESYQNNNNVYVDENGELGEAGREYYAVAVKYPEVGDDELYGNMFAVSSTSGYVYASIEVIAALNTNSELRNILQYGVEGVHYTIDDNGVLERIALNQEEISRAEKEGKEVERVYYSMDIRKTGNSFVAHPEEGNPADHWEIFKKQNGEAVVNPLLGFDINSYLEMNSATGMLDNALLETLADANAKVLEWINAAPSKEALLSILEAEGAKFAKAGAIYDFNDPSGRLLDVGKLTSPDSTEDSAGDLPNVVYYNWMIENGFLPS